jgi:tetratricopeptide (TPR) repeat protein
MTVKRFFFAAPLCFALSLCSARAHAGPGSTAPEDTPLSAEATKQRREWMHKGNAEYVQKHWDAARDCYLKAWDIKRHFTIAANLAEVEMRLGHYAEAAGYLKYVLANLPEEQQQERQSAEKQLLECRSHLTAVRVAVDVSNATVLVDGRDVGQTPLHDELLLEPGKHVISVTKPGYPNLSRELSAEGNQVDVTLTLEKPASESKPVSPHVEPAAPPHIDRASSSKAYRTGSYIGFGVAAVGVGVGSYFLLRARSAASDSDSEYRSCLPNCSTGEKQRISSLDDQAAHQRTAGGISFVVGGVALATGITLLLTEPKTKTATAAVHPWVGLGLVGLAGSF